MSGKITFAWIYKDPAPPGDDGDSSIPLVPQGPSALPEELRSRVRRHERRRSEVEWSAQPLANRFDIKYTPDTLDADRCHRLRCKFTTASFVILGLAAGSGWLLFLTFQLIRTFLEA